MPTHTTNYDASQYQYVMATKEPGESVSKRVREILDAGIEVEKNE